MADTRLPDLFFEHVTETSGIGASDAILPGNNPLLFADVDSVQLGSIRGSGPSQPHSPISALSFGPAGLGVPPIVKERNPVG
jgi:hypothetical protein